MCIPQPKQWPVLNKDNYHTSRYEGWKPYIFICMPSTAENDQLEEWEVEELEELTNWMMQMTNECNQWCKWPKISASDAPLKNATKGQAADERHGLTRSWRKTCNWQVFHANLHSSHRKTQKDHRFSFVKRPCAWLTQKCGHWLVDKLQN